MFNIVPIDVARTACDRPAFRLGYGQDRLSPSEAKFFMPNRRHWLLALLLLPLLLAFSGSGDACGLTSERQLGSGVQQAKGQPFDYRYAISVGAIELADEEDGPPKKTSRAHTIVLWPRGERSATWREGAPGHIGGAPVACAARPRAPPVPA